MPLRPGSPVGETIRELYHHGSRPRSRAQIIAIAEENHRRHADGGAVLPKRAEGGLSAVGFPTVQTQATPQYSGLGYFSPPPGSTGIPYALQMKALQEAQKAQALPKLQSQEPPSDTAQSFAGGGNLKLSGGVGGSLNLRPPKSLARATEPIASGGFIHSAIPGRTDRLAMNVRNGSHIIPADVVSSMGQGNSLAGARHLDMMMRALPQIFNRGGTVHPSPPPRVHDHEPILAAGGEYVVPPEEVRRVGEGDHEKGHKRLDKMIVNVRRREAKRMLKLPPPKK